MTADLPVDEATSAEAATTEADPIVTDTVSSRCVELAFVLVVTLCAFVLFTWGARFGLPNTYHPDEHQYVETAVDVLGGELNPQRFNNPSMYKYTLAGVDLAWLAVGRLAGRYGSLDEFVSRAQDDPAPAYLLARLVTALLGALTVGAVYVLGRTAYDVRVGAVASVLLAGSFLFARQAHFAVSDIPATLLTTLALVACTWVLSHARSRDYVLAGMAIGAATATKYSMLAAAVPLVLAHVLAEESTPSDWLRRVIDRRLLVTALVTIGVFLLAVPFSVLDWDAFYEDVSLLHERGRTGFKGLRLADDVGWVFYLKTLRWGLGLPYLAVSLIAVVAAVVRHRRIDVVLVSFPVVLYLYLGRQLLLFERFVLPALPVLAVLTSMLLWWLVGRTSWSQRTRLAVVVGITAVLLAVPVSNTLRFDWLLTQTDTRDLAREWIEVNVPDGARVLAHSNGPQLAGGDRQSPGATRVFDVEYVGTTTLGKQPLDEVLSTGHEYAVLSSFAYDRRLLDPERDASTRAFYHELDERAELLYEARPEAGELPIPFVFAHVYGPATHLWALERPGPTVRVYRLDGATR